MLYFLSSEYKGVTIMTLMISFHVKPKTHCLTAETEMHFLPPSLSSNGIVQKSVWECEGSPHGGL